jgi:hypothetical protein
MECKAGAVSSVFPAKFSVKLPAFGTSALAEPVIAFTVAIIPDSFFVFDVLGAAKDIENKVAFIAALVVTVKAAISFIKTVLAVGLAHFYLLIVGNYKASKIAPLWYAKCIWDLLGRLIGR